MIWRMLTDDPNFDTSNYHGMAERYWGLLRADGSEKPVFETFRKGMIAASTAPSPAPVPPAAPVPVPTPAPVPTVPTPPSAPPAPPSSARLPFGAFDTPTDGATGVAGSIGVTGWALDDTGVTNVRIYRNCLPGIDAPSSCQEIAGNSVVFIGDAAFLPGA